MPVDGLVAWYEMDGSPLDSSPNENHGTPTGVSSYIDRNGIEGGALWFNGNGDILQFYSESIGIQAEFTSAVASPPGGTQSEVYEIHNFSTAVAGMAFNGPSSNPRTFHTSGFGDCQMRIDYASGGNATVQPGEWHHVALTFTLASSLVNFTSTVF